MQWNIDPNHTGIEFAVRHMGIATVRGRFRKFDGTVALDEDGRLRQAHVTIDAASIDTGVADRDNHLRSADFFEVGRFPTIVFRSTAIERAGNGTYRVTGDLTMHGQTRPVTFEVEPAQPVKDPWGNRRVAATATGKLNRKDWGLTWNAALETGGVLVSEKIKLEFDVSAIRNA